MLAAVIEAINGTLTPSGELSIFNSSAPWNGGWSRQLNASTPSRHRLQSIMLWSKADLYWP